MPSRWIPTHSAAITVRPMNVRHVDRLGAASDALAGHSSIPQEDIADSAKSLWETTTDATPRVAVAVAIVLAGWLLARGLRWLLHRRFRKNQTPSFATVMSKIVSWVFLGVVVLAAITITLRP